MKQKPILSFWQIWNLSFGFLGIQIGYSLQSAQTSRILSVLGADPSHLPLFWLAAPIAGLIVQPIIGMSSDHTWTRMGRRIPFILGGAIVSALAMFFMPNSSMVAHIMPPVFFGASMLLFMDCAFNVSMQPFRSLVGDMVNDKQRNLGYSVQSFIINIGAIVGSFLPFILTYFGMRNNAQDEAVPEVVPSVVWSYYIGGACLLLTVLWTSIRVKEYPPKEFAAYNNIEPEEEVAKGAKKPRLQIPPTMLQLAVVQFFSWFALFIMWVYAIGGIAENVWGTTDPNSAGCNEAGNWNGVLAGTYGLFAVLFSLIMPKIANKLGRKKVYSFALLMGAIGFVSMYFFKDKYLLILSMVGVGIAWAGILAMPYAILSAVVPAKNMGFFMGLFNATITIPQIVAGVSGLLLFRYVAGGSSIAMLLISGVAMLLASISVWIVNDKGAPETSQ